MGQRKGMYRILQCWFLLAPWAVSSQDCGGSVGANIFQGGDFGAGTANVLSVDPNIAPGYTYTTNVPPDDGFYTITNYTGFWNLFGGWMPITDNSPDFQGYMMVVNASFEPGVFFERTITGLCPNTDYLFTADLINLISPNYDELIKPQVSFLINGNTLYNTGDIEQTGTWNTYGFTFSTGPNETFLTLTLRNNAEGGIGNDLALDNLSFRPCGPEAYVLPEEPSEVCQGEVPVNLEATIVGGPFPTPLLQWQLSTDGGITWQDIPGATAPILTHSNGTPGEYHYRFYLAQNADHLANAQCRVFSNEKIIRIFASHFTIRDTICQDQPYAFGDRTIRDAGTYVDSLVSSQGCDSIVQLQLAQTEPPRLSYAVDVSHPSCTGASDGAIQVEVIEAGAPPVTIQLLNQQTTERVAEFSGLSESAYILNMVDRFGCAQAERISIIDPPILELEASGDSVLQLGEEWLVELQVNQPVSRLSWSGDTSGVCSGLLCNPWRWRPVRDAVIVWEATTAPDCVARDTLGVSVQVQRDLYFPNVFSPNGDGRNDFFTAFAKKSEIQVIRELRIFDRWGGLVYEGQQLAVNNPTSGWDGRSRDGRLLPEGVYTYQAMVAYLDGVTVVKAGSIALIR